ncbi:MAG: HD domain-containing protein [Ectothiorhodospiraceae bacterium]|nr:HD domain-containing protein [Chromatiales bacterium]MCP5155989.1 HD domain-containing protein [Ectothiorhodospiraceae bacterium]
MTTAPDGVVLREVGDGDFVALLAEIFRTEGAAQYLGEAVSMSEHMLQTAANARAAGEPDALVVACLLHDIGHFANAQAAADDWHRRHDEAGGAFLLGRFPPEVVEPVRLHVAAKRYLCAVEPTYLDTLSHASVETLRVQGGPMSADEVAVFERNPHHRAAVRLRRYEEQGKREGAVAGTFDDHAPLVRRLLVTR